MRLILTVATHEFKNTYARRIFLVITAALPIVAVLALGVAWAIENLGDGEQKTAKVGYVDGTGLFTSHLAQPGLEFVPFTTPDEGMAAMLGENIKRLYVIADYYLKTGVVQRFKVGSGIDLGGDDDPGLSAFLLDNLSESVPESDVIERLKDPLVLANIAVDSEGNRRDLDGARIAFFLGLAFLLMLSLAITGGFLLQGVGEEKESRIMEVLLSSVTPSQFMIGKVLGLGAAGLTQILIWVISARVLLEVLPSVLTDKDFTLPGIAPTLLAVAFFVLGYLLFATLNAGLGAVAPTRQESQQLSIIVALPLIIPIYAWVYIVENPTAGVTKLLTFLPFTAPIVVLQRLGPGAIEPWEVAVSLVILALTVAGSLMLVGRVFRAFLLSYGKQPGLRVLWRALVHG